MNQRPPRSFQRIDIACDAFESEWRSGGSPQLEPFLVGFEEPLRAKLFAELLVLDVCYRKKNGRKIARENYLSRFPDQVKVIDHVLASYLPPSADSQSVALESTRLYEQSEGETQDTVIQPTVFGDYVLLEQLGQGGMGVVYKARHIPLDRLVAMKLIRPEKLRGRDDSNTKRYLQRFRNEAAAAARIDDDHIIRVYEVGEVQNQPFYSMQFVEGETLESLMAGGLSQREVAGALLDRPHN